MRKVQVCWECCKERERCRVVTQHENGDLEYVCPQCWKALDYDLYMSIPPANRAERGNDT